MITALARALPGLATAFALAATPAAAQDAAQSVQQVIERLAPSLVSIEVVAPEFDDGRAKKQVASGSGVIISAEGDVLTNSV